MLASDRRRAIGDWARFHTFPDDCDYPLISPSDQVLDDLDFRLGLLESGGLLLHEIGSRSRERWEALPHSKGKERRLRRKGGPDATTD